nr:hypothetical protein [Tanacetum cinerariifolium]
MLQNLDQLEKHLAKEEFQELESVSIFRVLLLQFQTFIYSQFSVDSDEGLMIRMYFIAYTKTDVPLFHATLIQHMESLRKSILERTKHKQEYDNRMNEIHMQSKEGKIDSSKAVGQNQKSMIQAADPRIIHMLRMQISKTVNDKEPMEKVDSNITPDSTNMSHRGGEIDHNVEKCQVSCPLLDLSFDNVTTEFSNQSLEKSSKESYGLKDMVHNYYLEEAKKKTQDKNRNLKPRKMPSARTHHTPNACIPKPRSNNQTFRN